MVCGGFVRSFDTFRTLFKTLSSTRVWRVAQKKQKLKKQRNGYYNKVQTAKASTTTNLRTVHHFAPGPASYLAWIPVGCYPGTACYTKCDTGFNTPDPTLQQGSVASASIAFFPHRDRTEPDEIVIPWFRLQVKAASRQPRPTCRGTAITAPLPGTRSPVLAIQLLSSSMGYLTCC